MELTVGVIIFVLGYILGAITHEKDLSNNYNKHGDASSWFFEIKR